MENNHLHMCPPIQGESGMTKTELFLPGDWLEARDGFCLCRRPLSTLLHRLGIRDTGISPINKQDVDGYFDDWHLFRLGQNPTVCGLAKLREQEHDFLPGFSDRDDPAVTISFVAFPLETLEALSPGDTPGSPAMERFVDAFRDVTERFSRPHDSQLQRYFSNPASLGSYAIANAYVGKILSLFPDGRIPLPDRFLLAPRRLLAGLEQLGGDLYCPGEKCLKIRDPKNPTLREQQAILAVHTCNLTFNSFAAEVKFHADALILWPKHLPYVGKRFWYRSALRADMQFGPERRLYEAMLCPYHDPNSRLVKQQRLLHGAK